MPRNGNGVFALTSGSFNPAVAGQTAAAADWNTLANDLEDAISGSIAADGQTTITANLPMAGFRHTGVGAATARTQYARATEVQDGTLTYVTSPSGTDTITGTIPITMTAYAAGQQFRFKAAGTNTGATTINLNSIGAKTIQKLGAALVAGDITANDMVDIIYDGTQFQMISPARTPVLTAGGIPASALNVNGATSATPATGDEIIFGDVSDSNNRKKATLGTIGGVIASSVAGWVPIKTVTAANDATIDFVNGTGGVVLDSTYKAYIVVLTDVVPATDGTDFYFRTSTDGGSTYNASASDYDYAFDFVGQGANTNEASTGAAQIVMAKSVGSDTGESLSGQLMIANPAGTTNKKIITFDFGWVTNAGEFKASKGGGFRDAVADVDAFRFIFSSGNVEAGTFTLYGLRSPA